MKYQYHIIVIGAGSAGLVVASGASKLGAKVALLEAEKMGGDCLNTGCVPSKAFLKCAHLAKDIQESEMYGIKSKIEPVDLSNVMDHVKATIAAIEPHDSVQRYEEMGVDVYESHGELIDNHSVRAGDKIITGKSIVIATGSNPVIPPIKGLSEIDYLTNKNIFDLSILPKHLIVLGGGPIGLELGQGFKHLGSEVTIIDRSVSLFGKDDSEVASLMENRLVKDGITLNLSSKILEIKQVRNQKIVVIEKDGKIIEIIGDQVLVSLGRAPETKGLGLENAGILTNKRGYVQTDKKLRTNIKNIYACGDIAGPFQFTHMAGYQASIVIKNSIFNLGSKTNYSAVPWTTYTKPEVAHVGYTQKWARDENLFVDSVIVQSNVNDRSLAEGDTEGFLKLIIGKNKKIIGATLVGNKAGEMIPIVTMAIKQNLTSSAFLSIIFSYPTQSEIFMAASLEKLKDSIKDWHKKIIRALFLR